MEVVAGIVPAFAIVFFGSILACVLVRLSSIQTQKKARMEMKRHLQKMEAPESA